MTVRDPRSDDVEAIGLGLPREWQEFPLEPEAFEARLQAQASDLREQGASVVQVRRHELLMRQLRELLDVGDVRYLATLTAVVELDGQDLTADGPDDGPDADEPVGLLAAATAVAVRDRHSLGAPGPLTVDLLLHGLGGQPREDRPVDLDPPAIVELPAGRAVRLARRHRTRHGGDPTPFESIAQSFLLPFDRGERLCTLQFVTPNVEQGGSFSRLFDGAARTLRLFRPGDPTSFADPDAAATAETDTQAAR
ncbi:MAG: hypothetical protein JJT89_13585 [Nitriliruptoraceae bacterium]|nr:hypothetical protein [Nitriliruptoraceae bacterium]